MADHLRDGIAADIAVIEHESLRGFDARDQLVIG
jgi:hypothetical protein